MRTGTVQALSVKMAEQYAERAWRGEGVRIGTTDWYEFPQGSSSNVVSVLADGVSPFGHIGKDPHRADELRKIIKDRAAR